MKEMAYRLRERPSGERTRERQDNYSSHLFFFEGNEEICFQDKALLKILTSTILVSNK